MSNGITIILFILIVLGGLWLSYSMWQVEKKLKKLKADIDTLINGLGGRKK
jgi:hypothetical protein